MTDVYRALLEANAQAFAAGNYETAYHALMAALHAAQFAHDAERLDAVAELAARQQAELDELVPAHRLSTGSAAQRSHPGVYALAARNAATQASLARLHRRGPA